MPLQEFIHNYVSTSLALFSEQSDTIPLKEWEDHLRKRVSKDTGLSYDQVVFLHHPFHWTFFSNGCKEYSPLELVHGKGIDSNLYVKLKEKVTPEEIDTLANKVYESYGKSYLPERISGTSIPLQ
jgi:hypothetical protein